MCFSLQRAERSDEIFIRSKQTHLIKTESPDWKEDIEMVRSIGQSLINIAFAFNFFHRVKIVRLNLFRVGSPHHFKDLFGLSVKDMKVDSL